MGKLIAEPVIVRVPWDVARLSANKTAKMHYHERSDASNAAKLAARVAWLHAGEPYALGKVEVHLCSYRKRTLDDDNIVRGFKPIRDFLFSDRVTPDDSPKWVRLGGVDQVIEKQMPPCLDVIIQPYGGNLRERVLDLEAKMVSMAAMLSFYEEATKKRKTKEEWETLPKERQEAHLLQGVKLLVAMGVFPDPD